ncbi:MAG: tRNA glutamyl-Q(34) synthetase GluQRS [Clostridiales bacterium]|nr:tRNA glutamyl-Q(34) synthetase GluQRS [Clostridiales bacterium]
MSNVVGRFAPSPSGRMHLGNAFSALLAWLSVRSADGTLVLRMEDLDPERTNEAFASQIREDLRWLGLDWDQEGTRQRLRTEAYEAAVEALRQRGLLYPCWCTRGDLKAASAPHASDGKPIYPGTCRHLTAAQRAAKTRPPLWRVMVPDEEICFVDGLQGTYRENLARACGDFIVQRADGVHAYQLAVVVDDAAMGVNEVVRGRDLLDSTPRQIYLQRQLKLPLPQYYHVPLLLAMDGRRLSKRERDLDLGALRQRYTPPQLLGKLAFWAGILPREEPVTAQELIGEFSWQKVRRADIATG